MLLDTTLVRGVRMARLVDAWSVYVVVCFFFVMLRRPPRSTQSRSSAASDVYKRQVLGPLDRIIQAAGRCNREGKLESGLCSIVNLVDSKTPPGDYRTGRDIALQLISTANDIDNPDCIKRYFDILFSCVQTDKDNLLDKHTQCEFETVAHGARLIADATVPVVMRQYAPREVDRLRRVKPEHRHSKWYQDIAKYSVNIFYAQRDQLISSGELVPIDEGDEECDIFIYLGPYGKLIGFGERDTSDG